MVITKIKRKKIEIDATGKAPGRLASEIAVILMGKNKVGYVAYIDSGDKVIIFNVDAMHLTGDKLNQKVFYHHSLYPGGLKEVSVKKLMKEKPAEVLKHAVSNMLPKNRLRTARLLRLSFK